MRSGTTARGCCHTCLVWFGTGLLHLHHCGCTRLPLHVALYGGLFTAAAPPNYPSWLPDLPVGRVGPTCICYLRTLLPVWFTPATTAADAAPTFTGLPCTRITATYQTVRCLTLQRTAAPVTVYTPLRCVALPRPPVYPLPVHASHSDAFVRYVGLITFSFILYRFLPAPFVATLPVTFHAFRYRTPAFAFADYTRSPGGRRRLPLVTVTRTPRTRIPRFPRYRTFVLLFIPRLRTVCLRLPSDVLPVCHCRSFSPPRLRFTLRWSSRLRFVGYVCLPRHQVVVTGCLHYAYDCTRLRTRYVHVYAFSTQRHSVWYPTRWMTRRTPPVHALRFRTRRAPVAATLPRLPH